MKKKPSAPKKSPSTPMPEVLLRAKPVADVVVVPARVVLAIEGQGEPGGQAFQRSIAALYGVTYTLKFARKRGGKGDFKVGALEALWRTGAGEAGFVETPRAQWRWRLRLAVPREVDAKEVSAAIAAAVGKKGGKLEGNREASLVQLERIPAGRWGRVLHVGPYAAEAPSIAKAVAAIALEGEAPGSEHVEIYLNDPRRTRPEKVRTVLLVGLASARRAGLQARRVPDRKAATRDLHFSPTASGRPVVR
jgi:hypothetical protein